jgi:hypothetical protein
MVLGRVLDHDQAIGHPQASQVLDLDGLALRIGVRGDSLSRAFQPDFAPRAAELVEVRREEGGQSPRVGSTAR